MFEFFLFLFWSEMYSSNALEIKILDINFVVQLQKCRICFFQPCNVFFHFMQVHAWITFYVWQTEQIVIHQRTVGVKVKTFVVWVVAQWVQSAAKRFAFTHIATDRTQMFALGFYTNRTDFFLFGSGQGNFKRRITSLHIAAPLTFRTVVKQHAQAPNWRRRFDRTSLL